MSDFGVRHRDAALESGDSSPQSKDWPHAPVHRLSEAGVYMVTAGTYRNIHYLNSSGRLELVMRALFKYAEEFGWELHAWAVMANHYHFIARPNGDPRTMRRFVSKLHMTTAKTLNLEDGTPGRRVWYQYWDSCITFKRSYLARLNYVNQNPVHHGVELIATAYRWCSAAWFERVASPAFVKTVKGFETGRIRVNDDF